MYVTSREIVPLPGRLQETIAVGSQMIGVMTVSYTHLRAHETLRYLV